MFETFSGLKTAGHIERASTSAGLYNSETGERFPDSGGLHIYFPVYDASDIERAVEVAHKRLVLTGYGWIFIDKAGRMHVRSPLDSSVGKAERLFFEGAPVLAPPLKQDAEKRRCKVVDGDIVNTREVFPDLEPAELREYAAIVAQLKEASAGKAEIIRKADDEGLAREIATKQKIDIKDARARVALRHRGQLAPQIVIEFDDPEIGAKTVDEILADPERYIGETAADPLAGVEYGRCKCMVMRDEREDYLFISSFAHGGAVYRLLPGFGQIERALHAAAFDRVAEVYAALIVDGDAILSTSDKARLRELAAQRAEHGVKVRDLDRAVAAERNRREEERREAHKAETRRNDPRVQLDAPRSHNQEVTPLAHAVDAALAAVEGPDKPLRNRQGELVTFAETKPSALHALRSEAEVAAGADMPAPDIITMRRADLTQISLLIERHVALRDPEGKCGNCAPEEKLCRAVAALPWGETKVPACVGFQQLPLVLPDGSLKSGRGYDLETGLMFRVPRELDDMLLRRRAYSLDAAKKAYRFLVEEWLGDVLTDDAGKAALIAICLTIIERHLLDEHICAAISAVQAKTGKTTAIRMICAAVLGDSPPARAWPEDETERQKALLAIAMEGVPAIVFDNVAEFAKLNSTQLCMALTSGTVGGRILGTSRSATPDSRFVPIFTGNSIRPVGDLASRCLVVKMVANSSQPENREFRHIFPVAWTKQNRAKILVALYALLLVRRERREPKSRFKMWDRLVAHPIQVVSGIDLTNSFAENEQSDEEKQPTTAKLALLHRVFGEQEFTVKALHEKLTEQKPDETGKQLLAAFRRGSAMPTIAMLRLDVPKLENHYMPLGAVEYCLKSRFDGHTKTKVFRVVARTIEGVEMSDDTLADVLSTIEEGDSPF